MSSCHHVIMSSCHHVIMSSCHEVIMSSGYIQSSGHMFISSSGHRVTMSASGQYSYVTNNHCPQSLLSPRVQTNFQTIRPSVLVAPSNGGSPWKSWYFGQIFRERTSHLLKLSLIFVSSNIMSLDADHWNSGSGVVLWNIGLLQNAIAISLSLTTISSLFDVPDMQDKGEIELQCQLDMSTKSKDL